MKPKTVVACVRPVPRRSSNHYIRAENTVMETPLAVPSIELDVSFMEFIVTPVARGLRFGEELLLHQIVIGVPNLSL